MVTVQGRILQALHGPRGDANGAILDDGTTLKFPPPSAWQMSSLLQPGQVGRRAGLELYRTATVAWSTCNRLRPLSRQHRRPPARTPYAAATAARRLAPPPPPPAPPRG